MRLGGWLFERRTWLPLPVAAALLLLPPSGARSSSPFVGVAIIVLGEAIRLWAVHHIGVISRTRSDRLGPLVSTGPFGIVRNPLYLGNIVLWIGFALSARLIWIVPLVAVVLGLEYHAIVCWEERLLESRRGAEYHEYAARVPRWVPSFDFGRAAAAASDATRAPHSWRETVFSERGTLIAIVVGCLLLYLKLRV